jgi:uncharacterized protein (DUF433 family)
VRDDRFDVQTAPRHADTRIVKDPRVCGGEPTVAGTRVPVSAIVTLWQYYEDRARVLNAYPRLNDQSLDAALSYYAAHGQEIDDLIAESEQTANARD